MPESTDASSTGQGVLAPLARASGRVVAILDRLAFTGWAAAAGIVVPIVFWVYPVEVGGGVALGVLAAVLLVPGGVIFLLSRAVDSVAQLPSALITQVREGSPNAKIEFRGVFRSAWNVGRYLLGIRGVLWSLKDQLASAGAVVRLASMPLLVSVLAAVVLIGVMIPVAAAMILAALLL